MFNRKGQSTLEYAIVVAVIVAGLLAMQFYIKRGWEGKLRNAADNMGEQFDPGAYTADFTINTQQQQTSNLLVGGQTTTTHDIAATNTKIGSDTVAAWDPNLNVYGQ